MTIILLALVCLWSILVAPGRRDQDCGVWWLFPLIFVAPESFFPAENPHVLVGSMPISDGFKAYFWCLKSKSWLKSPCPHVCWFYIIPRFLICFVWLRFLLLNLIIYGSDIINPHRFLDSEPSAVRMTWIPAKRGTGWWYGLGLMRCLAILLLEIPKKSGLMMVKYWSLSKA